jgi:hypothetical protein
MNEYTCILLHLGFVCAVRRAGSGGAGALAAAIVERRTAGESWDLIPWSAESYSVEAFDKCRTKGG